MTLFLLIRHGDNDLLDRRILAGRKPGVHLNERGKRQAADLMQSMAALKLEAIYSSPLERARETAEPLALACGLPVHLMPALNEVDFGEWTGTAFDDLADDPHWRAFNTFRSSTRIPGGEIIVEVQARMLCGLEEICRLHPDGRIAVFGHGDPIRSLLAHFLGMPLDMIPRLRIDPGSISAVNYEAWGAEVIGVNMRELFKA